MSGLFDLLTDHLSDQKKPPVGQQSSCSGLLHKINDALTGQKHPQDYQNQPKPNTFGSGYGGAGGPGYQQSDHSDIICTSKTALPLGGSDSLSNSGGYGGYGPDQQNYREC